MKRIILVAVLLLSFLSPATAPVAVPTASAATCSLVSPAFCDPLDTVTQNTINTRAGDLNALIWGVSRSTQQDNYTQGLYDAWADTQMDVCGTTVVVPAGQGLTKICNGHMVEGQDDNQVTQIQAYYPRRPFDIAGRTGKATFDISDDTQGTHTAWPSWVYTDQPIPAPGNGDILGDNPGVFNIPQNSFGVEFAGAFNTNCTNYQGPGNLNPPSTGVSDMWITQAGVPSVVNFISDGCVKEPTGPDDPAGMNHVEIDLSPTSVVVFMSDPGGLNFKQVAHTSVTMPLTRGLTWMEDHHYNADKISQDGVNFHTQRVHTFAWANFGFDGPVLPGDLGYEIPESGTITSVTSSEGLPIRALGWRVNTNAPTSWTFTDVAGVQNASAALIELTFFPWDTPTVSVTINGHPHSFTWTGATFEDALIALPISPTELVNGANVLTMQTSGPNALDVANLDIILAGAANNTTPTPVPTDTPTVVPTPTPTNTPLPTNTPTSTPTPLPGSYIQSIINITPPAEIPCLGPTSSFLFGADGIVVVDPNNHNSVYFTAENCSQNEDMWKSTDAGATWNLVASNCSCDGLRIDPANSLHMYEWAGVRGNTGFGVTTNGGVTWTTPSGFSAGYGTSWNNDLYNIAVDPNNFNHILVMFHSPWPGSSSAGVLESFDGGNTNILHPAPTSAWGASENPFFVDTSGHWIVASQNDGMWRTLDSGTSWTQISTQDMQHGGDNLVCQAKLAGGYCDTSQNMFLGALHEILKSSDGGATWVASTPRGTINGYYDLGYDGHTLLVQPANTGGNAGEGAVPYFISLASDGITWQSTGVTSCFGSPTATCDGPFFFSYDAISNIMYSSNWGAGLWKLQLAGPGSATPTPTPLATNTPAPTPTSTPTPSGPTPTPTPTATNTPLPTPTPTSTPVPTSTPTPSAFTTRIGGWMLYGANMPWLNWNSDFGGGGSGGVSSNLAVVDAKLARAQAMGMHYIRWWVFEGGSPQILRDVNGNPTGLNPKVYNDIDVAVAEANRYNISYDLVLFGSTNDDAVTHNWWENATQRSELVTVLTPLFKRYASTPQIHTWEVVNEPEWQVRNAQTTMAGMLATFDAIAAAIHANSPQLTTVGNAQVQDMIDWRGHALDYYSPHYYDAFGSGVNNVFARTASSLAIDNKPVVVGEFQAQPSPATPSAQARYQALYNEGYAGAWAWSLSPENTSDQFAIDDTSASLFAQGKTDLGPQLNQPPTIGSDSFGLGGFSESFWSRLVQTGNTALSLGNVPHSSDAFTLQLSRRATQPSLTSIFALHNFTLTATNKIYARAWIAIDAIPHDQQNHIGHLFSVTIRNPSDGSAITAYWNAHQDVMVEDSIQFQDKTYHWNNTDALNRYGDWRGLEIDIDESGANPVITWLENSPQSGTWRQVDTVTDTTTGTRNIFTSSQLRIGTFAEPFDTPWNGTLTARFDDVQLSDQPIIP